MTGERKPQGPRNDQNQKFTYLELAWHNQFWSIHTYQGIYYTKDENGQDNGKVADQLSCLKKKIKKKPGTVQHWINIFACVGNEQSILYWLAVYSNSVTSKLKEVSHCREFIFQIVFVSLSHLTRNNLIPQNRSVCVCVGRGRE